MPLVVPDVVVPVVVPVVVVPVVVVPFVVLVPVVVVLEVVPVVVPSVVPEVVVPTVVPVVVEPLVVASMVPVVVVPVSEPEVEPAGVSVLVLVQAERATPALKKRAATRMVQAEFLVCFIGSDWIGELEHDGRGPRIVEPFTPLISNRLKKHPGINT